MNKGIQLGLEVESSNSKNSRDFGSFLKNTKKILAFTLAETLIVMGIIGVVAALTIPNLNSSTNNQEKVTKVKKIYAELNEAHNRATAVYGPLETWCVSGNSCRKRYFDRITEFMKIKKSCRSGGDCMTATIGRLNFSKTATAAHASMSSANWDNSVILSSGASIYFSIADSCTLPTSSDYQTGYSSYCGTLYVDIDGPYKGDSVSSIDVFLFIVTKDGVFPQGGGNKWTDDIQKSVCFSNGKFCTAWVINTGNMDYLDVSHSSNAGKCNHSNKTLSTTVTSCK